jgi:acetyl-CoA acetyltransferase
VRARAAVTGLGHSKVYRRDEVDLGSLTLDACLQAIEDAGLTRADVDGVVTDPMQPFEGAGAVDGTHTVTPEFVIANLGLDVVWFESVDGSVARSLVEAVNAVSSGVCRAVIAFRSMHSPQGRYGLSSPVSASGRHQFRAPYGLYAPAMFAHLWTRYMHEYGTTREQMAPFIVNNRRNALIWEHGYWYQHRPEPLTEADYLAARLVSWPLGLHDCDIPIQGSGAFVVTSAERAGDGPNRPAYVHGWAMPGRWGSMLDFDVTLERATRLGRDLFQRAGIRHEDVDVLNVYDGFSIFVPLYLETLGFCGEGEAFDFMTPERIAIEGELPLNTSSGSLGSGRLHGLSHFYDSVLQVQGRSGARQVQGAEIAVAVAGGPPGTAPGIVFGATPD